MNLFPKLVVNDARRAIEFYTTAFGVKETELFETPDGKVVNVRLVLGDLDFTLKDEDSVDAAPGLDGPPVIIHLEAPDPDAVGARMEAGGATLVFPFEDHPYGRMGRLRDPFGHVWIVRETDGG